MHLIDTRIEQTNIRPSIMLDGASPSKTLIEVVNNILNRRNNQTKSFLFWES